ncbi:hypothetical protein GCM10027610_021240 [Dactylosporangium cerinum]
MLVGVLLGVAGCAQRAKGTDGNLVDDWQVLAAPRFDLPSVGMCLESTAKETFNPSSLKGTQIECERGHTLEVVLVGTVEGNAAQTSEPPAAAGEAYQAAYTACGKAASDYVGGDWHTGMLGINVQWPNRTPWTGGLRSYVCSVYSLSSAYGVTALSTSSLKGSLAGNAPKAMHCLDVNGTKDKDGWWDRLQALTPIDCAQPHEAEFVGAIQVGVGNAGPLPDDKLLHDWSSDACWAAVAKFVGLTDAQLDSRAELGITWDRLDKLQWESGERHERCFALLSPGKKVRASIKGLGKGALPV